MSGSRACTSYSSRCGLGWGARVRTLWGHSVFNVCACLRAQHVDSNVSIIIMLSRQNEADIELYRREMAELAEREARQREVLRGLWEERQALIAKDERWLTRHRH